MIKHLLITLLFLFVTALPGCTDVTSTVNASKNKLKPGESADIAITYNNTNVDYPITIVATCTWKDTDGTERTATASCDLTVIHPITLSVIKVPLSPNCAYVTDTAKFNGKYITAQQIDNMLSCFPLANDGLNEIQAGSSGILSFTIKGK